MGKKTGRSLGPAHSGWGLQVNTAELPNYVVPPYDGIGANEYIVDVTHTVPGPDGTPVPAVDFFSTVDTPYVWELKCGITRSTSASERASAARRISRASPTSVSARAALT